MLSNTQIAWFHTLKWYRFGSDVVADRAAQLVISITGSPSLFLLPIINGLSIGPKPPLPVQQIALSRRAFARSPLLLPIFLWPSSVTLIPDMVIPTLSSICVFVWPAPGSTWERSLADQPTKGWGHANGPNSSVRGRSTGDWLAWLELRSVRGGF